MADATPSNLSAGATMRDSARAVAPAPDCDRLPDTPLARMDLMRVWRDGRFPGVELRARYGSRRFDAYRHEGLGSAGWFAHVGTFSLPGSKATSAEEAEAAALAYFEALADGKRGRAA